MCLCGAERDQKYARKLCVCGVLAVRLGRREVASGEQGREQAAADGPKVGRRDVVEQLAEVLQAHVGVARAERGKSRFTGFSCSRRPSSAECIRWISGGKRARDGGTVPRSLVLGTITVRYPLERLGIKPGEINAEDEVLLDVKQEDEG